MYYVKHPINFMNILLLFYYLLVIFFWKFCFLIQRFSVAMFHNNAVSIILDIYNEVPLLRPLEIKTTLTIKTMFQYQNSNVSGSH